MILKERKSTNGGTIKMILNIKGCKKYKFNKYKVT